MYLLSLKYAKYAKMEKYYSRLLNRNERKNDLSYLIR